MGDPLANTSQTNRNEPFAQSADNRTSIDYQALQEDQGPATITSALFEIVRNSVSWINNSLSSVSQPETPPTSIRTWNQPLQSTTTQAYRRQNEVNFHLASEDFRNSSNVHTRNSSTNRSFDSHRLTPEYPQSRRIKGQGYHHYRHKVPFKPHSQQKTNEKSQMVPKNVLKPRQRERKRRKRSRDEEPETKLRNKSKIARRSVAHSSPRHKKALRFVWDPPQGYICPISKREMQDHLSSREVSASAVGLEERKRDESQRDQRDEECKKLKCNPLKRFEFQLSKPKEEKNHLLYMRQFSRYPTNTFVQSGAKYGKEPEELWRLDDDTGLMDAIHNRDAFDVESVLVLTKTDPNSLVTLVAPSGTTFPDSSRSFFHEACMCSTKEVVEILIEYGADPHRVGDSGYSPLAMAVLGDNVEVVAYLAPKYSRLDRIVAGHLADQMVHPDCIDALNFTKAEVQT